MNEAETRTHYILPALQKSGWGIAEGARIREEYSINKGLLIGNGKNARPDKADYVLQYKGQNLAVIEAKREAEYYTDGVAQAKSYAARLQVRFCYSTNGKQIYAIDTDTGNEADILVYPDPDALWAMTFDTANTWLDAFLSVPYEDKGGAWQPRYYQDNAVKQALNAIANDTTRILLTLATGTGKTAIAFQIAWKLFHSKWNLQKDGLRSPRILFLTDRNILANQAFNAFGAFEEEALIRITPNAISKKGKVPTHGSIYFSIFQSFMTEDEKGFRFGQYPHDFFDFIIIDECHRGGANDEGNWRGILDYFSDAVQLGLTATPKRKINADTYHYFGDPVYIYSLKEGINDGFLTPFRVQQISSNLDDYTYADKDIILAGEVAAGDKFDEADFNRKIVIKQREVYRIKQLLKLINQHDKTLIFCKTQRHAAMLRDLVNQLSASENPDYCQRVTAADGATGDWHLKAFQDDEKSIPTVLTTSQKLSTGVDAPQVKNIVLLRPVNSMIEFKQIIGRGTRLFEGKDYFTIIDFVGAHGHFKDSDWDGDPIEPQPVKPCLICGMTPCGCEKPQPKACEICGFSRCKCHKEPPMPIQIKLIDGTKRVISLIQTTFFDTHGKPITAQQFLVNLFGELPRFFADENALRKIWSHPDTRKKLLDELTASGYPLEQLKVLQKLINAQNSDLFDVLNYVAFNHDTLDRSHRATQAKACFGKFNVQQRIFLDFILAQYIKEGVDELATEKLPELLTLKYGSVADAPADLGGMPQIHSAFVDFQQHLYQALAA